jgi:hypothetical protein
MNMITHRGPLSHDIQHAFWAMACREVRFSRKHLQTLYWISSAGSNTSRSWDENLQELKNGIVSWINLAEIQFSCTRIQPSQEPNAIQIVSKGQSEREIPRNECMMIKYEKLSIQYTKILCYAMLLSQQTAWTVVPPPPPAFTLTVANFMLT